MVGFPAPTKSVEGSYILKKLRMTDLTFSFMYFKFFLGIWPTTAESVDFDGFSFQFAACQQVQFFQEEEELN